MKKTLISLALAATFVLPAAGVFAAKAQKPKPAKPAPKIVSAVCPVMGTKINDVKKAAGKSIYKGKTYYFCCGMCKPAFDKDPAKYAGTKK